MDEITVPNTLLLINANAVYECVCTAVAYYEMHLARLRHPCRQYVVLHLRPASPHIKLSESSLGFLRPHQCRI